MYWLKRHPIEVRAHFKECLVLTYACPEEALRPLLPPGLRADTFKGHAFIAVALVQTENLRPVFVPPFFAQNFFLAGYRVFARFKTPNGKNLRGLRILRSDTDRRLMKLSGNLLTHYNYRHSKISVARTPEKLEIAIRTPNAEADLHVSADFTQRPATLPPSSPFADVNEALRFAGPLPFTFDYEAETNSIIVIEGVRRNWHPKLVNATVHVNTFIHGAPFQGAKPRLASAFYIGDIAYIWQPGVRFALPKEAL